MVDGRKFVMTIEKWISECEERCKKVPPYPWRVIQGTLLEHWELYSIKTDEFMVQNNSNVEPSHDFLMWLAHAGEDLPKALQCLKIALKTIQNICQCEYHDGFRIRLCMCHQALSQIEEVLK